MQTDKQTGSRILDMTLRFAFACMQKRIIYQQLLTSDQMRIIYLEFLFYERIGGEIAQKVVCCLRQRLFPGTEFKAGWAGAWGRDNATALCSKICFQKQISEIFQELIPRSGHGRFPYFQWKFLLFQCFLGCLFVSVVYYAFSASSCLLCSALLDFLRSPATKPVSASFMPPKYIPHLLLYSLKGKLVNALKVTSGFDREMNPKLLSLIWEERKGGRGEGSEEGWRPCFFTLSIEQQ